MRCRRQWAAGLAISVLVGCGSEGGLGPSTFEVSRGVESVTRDLDESGGAVELVYLARLTLPPGALEDSTKVALNALSPRDLPDLPDGLVPIETPQPVAVTPHGQKLASSATIEMVAGESMDGPDGKPVKVPDADLRLLRLRDEKDTSWETVKTGRLVQAGEDSRIEGEFEFREIEDESPHTLRRIELELETFSIFYLVAKSHAVADAATPEGGSAGDAGPMDGGQMDAEAGMTDAEAGTGDAEAGASDAAAE